MSNQSLGPGKIVVQVTASNPMKLYRIAIGGPNRKRVGQKIIDCAFYPRRDIIVNETQGIIYRADKDSLSLDFLAEWPTVWIDLQGPWDINGDEHCSAKSRGLHLSNKDTLNIFVIGREDRVWRAAVGYQVFFRQKALIEYLKGTNSCSREEKDDCKGCSRCYQSRKVTFAEGGCKTLSFSIDEAK